MTAYVCVVEVRLHLNDSHDLKGKRKLLHSLKAQLRQRFGASVAEIGRARHMAAEPRSCAPWWASQRSARRADELERSWSRVVPDGCSFDRDVLSLADIRG